MKTQAVIGIQPSIIRWARESMGLSVADVAEKLKRPLDEVSSWENDSGSAPTYAQLESLAYKVFKRPLAVFFLPAPPDEIAPTREFRSLPNSDLENLHADTCVHVRKAHAYQLTLKEVFGEQNPCGLPLSNQITLELDLSISSQASALRNALGISLDKQIAWRNDDAALKRWRGAIEDGGIFVFKAPFKQESISGFCLVDEEFPLIYLNNSTTKTRQIFSLLHELAHLLLNVSGISKFESSYVRHLPVPERRIEQFCNQLAAEVLIPSEDFELQSSLLPPQAEAADDYQFSALASRYGVSREAILRRLLDAGKVSQAFYELKAKIWLGQKKSAKGGNYYASQNAYLSDRLAKEVIARHYRNQINVEQASEFLGIKPKNFSGLEQQIMLGATA